MNNWVLVGESGVMMLSGEYNVILDDKYRITLPAGMRKELDVSSVVITKGEDKCLWLYTVEKWEERFGDTLKENTDPFSKMDRRVLRKFVGPSQKIDIDKAGRILLPESLREYASITKDCIVLGQIDFMEIWNVNSYREYCDEDDEKNAGEFEAATEELSRKIKRNRGVE